jgi:hypothetical protein
LKGKVPGFGVAKFEEIADKAKPKPGCPIFRVPKAEISLTKELRSGICRRSLPGDLCPEGGYRTSAQVFNRGFNPWNPQK